MSQVTQEIVMKALQRAESKGLGTKETAELILDYMDIAGVLSNGDQSLSVVANPLRPAPVEDKIINAPTEQAVPTIEAPVAVGRVIGKKTSGDDNVWTTESLVEALNGVDWGFTAEPPGLDRKLEYRGTVIANPRGMEGAGVVFSCPEVTTPRDIPVFFTLGQKEINPKQTVADVKYAIEQQLSSLKAKVQNSATPLTNYPSDIESVGICGGTV